MLQAVHKSLNHSNLYPLVLRQELSLSRTHSHTLPPRIILAMAKQANTFVKIINKSDV
jgi:hypothetical protein